MKRVLWCGVVAWLLVPGPGCATFSRSTAVSVSVTNVLPTQASLLETSAALTLRLVNEGVEPLALAGGVHRLYLNESYVGRAVTSERITVPALGTVTQTVTVYLENLTLVRKVAELSHAQAPRIAYRIESRLHPADGRGFGSLATSTAGELDLSGFVNEGLLPSRAPTGR
jgi:LEA14-like dessication related protein